MTILSGKVAIVTGGGGGIGRGHTLHLAAAGAQVMINDIDPAGAAAVAGEIEQAGGQFAHHDGGIDDKHSALDAVLAAADLVICQTGCISHNAYWRVKDFCKRMGKQCVFVDNPSATSFSRSLRGVQLTAAPTTVAE